MDNEQRLALDALLHSTNVVSVFRGGAGTGKSFVLRELVEQVQRSGRRVVVLAPQRQQVVDMEKADFPSPTTVTNFLLKRELAEGAVVVVDEAGQIGGRQMSELLRLARERNARVILSGDTRQHGAVEASDALLAIERHSGVKPVELHTIRRQDPALGRGKQERARIKQYRKAVEVAAGGKLAESFDRLNKLGAVVACGLGEQADKLADEYVQLAEEKLPPLWCRRPGAKCIASTRRCAIAQGKGIARRQRRDGSIAGEAGFDQSTKTRQTILSARGGDCVQPKSPADRAGNPGKLAGIVKAGVLVEVDGKCVTVSNKVLDKITVCQTREIPVTRGDKLHLKANRKLASGARVTNGELVTVKSIQYRWENRISRRSHFGQKLPGISSRLRRHVLRLARQDGGLCPVFRFHHQGRNERATMVCHHFARAARHPHFHARQGATARKPGALRSQTIGNGFCLRSAPAQS